MENFEVRTSALPVYTGGPPANCGVCKFPNPYPWYVVFNTLHSELNYDTSTGEQRFEGNIHLCADHALELRAVIEEKFPDPALATMKAKMMSSEAARARAEKRADVAEKALEGMQDWITERPVGVK